jgi:hypothetical protein
MRCHGANEVGGDLAAVEGVCATRRHGAQRGRELRVAQHRADCLRRSVSLVEVGACNRVAGEMLLVLQQRVQSRRDREAAVGEPDRRLEQPGPGEPAVLPVRRLEHAQHARRADRAAADHGVVESHRLAADHEQVLVGRHRRCLAAVEGLHAPAVEVQQEGAAADARTLRFDQRQHHLHRNRCIERRAAGAQDLAAGLGGQRVGCCRHVPGGGR